MSDVIVTRPRVLTLTGEDGMEVRRTLPTLGRSLIGGWCFIDHYGPEDVNEHGGMRVAPHPHTGLQTLSWLFAGEVEHRDSAGNHTLIKRGEMNLMTAGRGISHSERSTRNIASLHGVQLWIALPDVARDVAPDFEHYVPTPTAAPGVTARVFMGTLLGVTSPVRTYSPLVGAQLDLYSDCSIALAIDGTMEHGVLVDEGVVLVNDVPVAAAELAYVRPGPPIIRLSTATGARIMLLGGAPLGESIVMWWNFIGRSHEEIADLREQWNREISGTAAATRFGLPIGDADEPLPAPPLPPVRLKPRG